MVRGVRRGSLCRLTSQVSERHFFVQSIYAHNIVLEALLAADFVSLGSARDFKILDASRLASPGRALYSRL